MKTLHVITGLASGGAERALFNVLAGGLANQFDSAVLSLRDGGVYSGRLRALGVPVYELGMQRGLPGPATVARLRVLARMYRPDVIQGWMYHGNLAASLAATLAPGRPALGWNIRHSLYRLSAEKSLTRQVIRGNRLLSCRADAIVYNSHRSRVQHEAFGFASSAGRVIPNGFDIDALRPGREGCEAIRQELGVPNEALVVGHVARFHPIKDHASFLQAAVRVARQLSQVRFLMAGREVNLENPLLAGIVPVALEDHFRFVGERGDVPKLMQAMDVFCQSSWSEAFPNVLGEAMATGVLCVATDVGDSADIVGATGIVVPPSDSAALARGLMSMLERTADERKTLGHAARTRVQTQYALPRIVDAYNELYQSLVPGSAAGIT